MTQQPPFSYLFAHSPGNIPENYQWAIDFLNYQNSLTFLLLFTSMAEKYLPLLQSKEYQPPRNALFNFALEFYRECARRGLVNEVRAVGQ